MRTTVIIVSLVFALACKQHEAPSGPPVAAQEKGGVQVIDLKISGGEYQPASFTVKPGVPVRLNVTRDEKPGCGEELVVPAHNIKKTIPVNQVTTIEFTPKKAGELEFTCGMSMMKGKIVVTGA